MKKVFVSNESHMVLESLKNINKDHKLFDSYYEKEVDDNFHVNVIENAKVYDLAAVFCNAIASGNVSIYGGAQIYGNAKIYDTAYIAGDAQVFGYAEVYGTSEVRGEAEVFNNAKIYDCAEVCDNAKVYDNAQVYGDARVSANSKVCDETVAESNVINIYFLTYNVTLTDNHIKIGCKQFTYEKAIRLNDRNIGEDFSKQEYDEFIQFKKIIIETIRFKKPELFKKGE